MATTSTPPRVSAAAAQLVAALDSFLQAIIATAADRAAALPKPDDDQHDLLTLRQAAKLTRLGEATLRYAVRSDELRNTQPGKAYLVTRADALAYRDRRASAKAEARAERRASRAHLQSPVQPPPPKPNDAGLLAKAGIRLNFDP